MHIRRFSAICLMALFVFCHTPVHVLHTLFADHKDKVSDTRGFNHPAQIDSTGAYCHLSSNVITAPYLPFLVSFKTSPIVYMHPYSKALNNLVITGVRLHSGLRAPPALS